jgi:hypothetical protein
MIKPFQNEQETLTIGELTVENRLDRVELYGSLAITKDQAGLTLAKELRELLDAAIAVMEKQPLAEKVSARTAERTDNPFKD